MARLQQLAIEADLDNFTPDQLKVFGMVMNIKGEKVREKILEHANPTFAEATAIVRAAEAASTKGARSTANRSSAPKPPQQQQPHRPRLQALQTTAASNHAGTTKGKATQKTGPPADRKTPTARGARGATPSGT